LLVRIIGQRPYRRWLSSARELVMTPSVNTPRLIIGGQLRKAREAIGLTRDVIADRLDVSPPEIEAWEEERDQPSLTQLESLADLYGREIDYFLNETPDVPAHYTYRTALPTPPPDLSPDARFTISRFEEFCRQADFIEQVLGVERRVALPEARPRETPDELAARLRAEIDIVEKPVRRLRDTLTGFGIRTFELPVPSGEFSGLSSPNASYGPRILINAKDLFGRRHFTLAHEYGHLLYRHGPSVCAIEEREGRDDPSPERVADLFAVTFLLPEEPLREDFARRNLSREPSPQEVGRIAGRWYVSFQAMTYRLEQLGLIRRGYAKQLLSHYAPPRIRTKGPRKPSWERQLGRPYVNNALQAYSRGAISLGKLATCLGVTTRKALNIARASGIEG
jgi:Zn-dependent peptidase ImmA (M78 family)/DNA-binding XRE family transcriptional regulator